MRNQKMKWNTCDKEFEATAITIMMKLGMKFEITSPEKWRKSDDLKKSNHFTARGGGLKGGKKSRARQTR